MIEKIKSKIKTTFGKMAMIVGFLTGILAIVQFFSTRPLPYLNPQETVPWCQTSLVAQNLLTELIDNRGEVVFLNIEIEFPDEGHQSNLADIECSTHLTEIEEKNRHEQEISDLNKDDFYFINYPTNLLENGSIITFENQVERWYSPTLVLPKITLGSIERVGCEGECYRIKGAAEIRELENEEGFLTIGILPVDVRKNHELQKRYECRRHINNGFLMGWIKCFF